MTASRSSVSASGQPVGAVKRAPVCSPPVDGRCACARVLAHLCRAPEFHCRDVVWVEGVGESFYGRVPARGGHRDHEVIKGCTATQVKLAALGVRRDHHSREIGIEVKGRTFCDPPPRLAVVKRWSTAGQPDCIHDHGEIRYLLGHTHHLVYSVDLTLAGRDATVAGERPRSEGLSARSADIATVKDDVAAT